MSVCHIWLGVARSKKRGRTMFRFLGGAVGGINCASCNRWRTVSALAGRKNHRRNNWLIRLIPKPGFSFLSSRIFSVMGAGSLASREPDFRFCRPTWPHS